MRVFFWLCSLASILGLWFASDIHVWLGGVAEFYRLSDSALLQVTLGILAGIFATKAADSSSELKRLLEVPEIRTLIDRAESARRSQAQEQQRLDELTRLVEHEAQQQYARDMLIKHRQQLLEHWNQVLSLQSMLEEPGPEKLDPKVQASIREFIVKTNYVEYAGRHFLRQIPLIGSLLHYLVGPIWEAYYATNIGRINRMLLRSRKPAPVQEDDRKPRAPNATNG